MATKNEKTVEASNRAIKDRGSFFLGAASSLGLLLTILFFVHVACPPRMHNWAPGPNYGYHHNHDQYMTENPNFYVQPRVHGLSYMHSDMMDGATAVTVS